MIVTVSTITVVLRITKREVWAGFVIAGDSCVLLYVINKDAIQLYYSIQQSSVDNGVQHQGASSTGGVIFSCLTTENHLKVSGM